MIDRNVEKLSQLKPKPTNKKTVSYDEERYAEERCKDRVYQERYDLNLLYILNIIIKFNYQLLFIFTTFRHYLRKKILMPYVQLIFCILTNI